MASQEVSPRPTLAAAAGVGRGTVQSVARALELFAGIVRADGPVGVSELASTSELPVGTVHRLLQALVASRFVQRDPETRLYSPGHMAFDLAARLRNRSGLLSEADPYLRALVDLTGESANLAILDGRAAVYVAHVEASRTVRMFTEVGNRAPLHASGTGKVLFANLPVEQRDTLLRELTLEPHTPRTITDRAALRRELDVVRERDHALDNGEFEEGVNCIAVPVRGATGEVIAAMSVSGPSSRLSSEGAASLVPRIQAVGVELSRRLGARR